MESYHHNLSRRERQIMDIIYQVGKGSVGEIRKNLPDPPSYSSVRALLRVLEEKGHVGHQRHGQRYVYHPTLSQQEAKRSAFEHLLKTFFNDSAEAVFKTLLEIRGYALTEAERLNMVSELDRCAVFQPSDREEKAEDESAT